MTICNVNCSGFAKGTDMSPDLLHTYLGLSGLSLAEPPLLPSLNPVDPALNITLRAKQHLLTLHKQWKSWFRKKSFNFILLENQLKRVFVIWVNFLFTLILFHFNSHSPNPPFLKTIIFIIFGFSRKSDLNVYYI